MVASVVLDVRLVGVPGAAALAHQSACLAARMRAGGVRLVVLHAGGLAGELAAVEALARLSLVARRGGAAVAVRGMSADLSSLVGLLGLAEVLAEPDEQAAG